MVYGIIGMINFAHGDIFMLGGFAALIVFLILTSFIAGLPVALLLLVKMVVAMLVTGCGTGRSSAWPIVRYVALSASRR